MIIEKSEYSQRPFARSRKGTHLRAKNCSGLPLELSSAISIATIHSTATALAIRTLCRSALVLNAHTARTKKSSPP